MKKSISILLLTSTFIFAENPKNDIAVDPYLFTPVALSELEYHVMHPNNYEYQSSILAFPGAEGYGKFTTGGRGGTIIHVANLNDSGTGSLRAALETTGARTIVFDVGGDIDLSSILRIGTTNSGTNLSYSNVTIAGETAPSPGIRLINYGIEIFAENVIIRYISIALGNENTDNGGTEQDCLRIRNWGTNGSLQNFMFDHLSLMWSTDENFSLQGNSSVNTIENVTLQNSILSEPTNFSGYGILMHDNLRNISVYGNYLALQKERPPLIGRGTDEEIEFINNVIYGYEYGAVITYKSFVDFIGNIYKNIPADKAIGYSIDTSQNSFTELVPEDGELYVADNFQVGPADYALYGPRVTARAQGTRSLTDSYITSWENTQAGIENLVLSSTIGNSIYRDAVDQRVIDYYASGTGSLFNSTNPATLPGGGWNYRTLGTHPAGYDTDNDGMADAWEISRSGSIALTANGDDDSDGYTNIEEFFHYRSGNEGSAPPPTGLKRNFFNKKKGFF